MKTFVKVEGINFGGFYNSEHSEVIDDKIETYDYDIDKVDYKATELNYLSNLLTNLNIVFKNASIHRPRHYNFETDTIDLEVNKDLIRKFDWSKVDFDYSDFLNYFLDTCKDVSTSRSGYRALCNYDDLVEDQNYKLSIFIDYNIVIAVGGGKIYELEFDIELN